MQSTIDKNQVLVCVFCTIPVHNTSCYQCGEYKNIMVLSEWEDYTGMAWEE